MPEYNAKVYELVSHSLVVEANDEEDAWEKAHAILSEGNKDNYDTEYEGFTGDYVIEEVK